MVSYPTRSFEFLQKVQTSATNGAQISSPHHGDQHESFKLDVIVVGAGLGGLASAVALQKKGHRVRVLEQAPEIAEVGAGIQIPPNSARILLKWGLGPLLGPNAIQPESMTFRRWENGKEIGYTKLIPDFQSNFGGPYFVIHRAHFHDALHKLAVSLGVEVRVCSKVVKYDVENGVVELEEGTTYTADLVIAADGVKSFGRQALLRDQDVELRKTGFAVYRATVNTEKMRRDEDTAWLLSKSGLNIWIGDLRHVMTYTISGGKTFNMVLSHWDESHESTWSKKDAITDMKAYFDGWDPCLTKVINMIDSTMKWPLVTGAPLTKWVHSSGKFLILGDAAHAMVPYMSQGAAMAVEDGAALAEAISYATSFETLKDTLLLWEQERLKRTSQMQEASLANGKLWHYADGPEQEARDAAMRPEVEGRSFSASPNQWSDPVTQWWAYGYDAEEAIAKLWNNTGSTSV